MFLAFQRTWHFPVHIGHVEDYHICQPGNPSLNHRVHLLLQDKNK